jgi:hypothetical protein
LIYYLDDAIENRDAMKVDAIREFYLVFPETTENLQWGDDLCFKVRGKIFAILGLNRDFVSGQNGRARPIGPWDPMGPDGTRV